MLLTAPAIDPSLMAFGLTALLVASSVRCERIVVDDRGGLRAPVWVPWAVLAVLAVASTLFGILHPEVFAALGGDGVTAVPAEAAGTP